VKNYEYLCRSANGLQVVYDPLDSHTSTHFNDTPKLKDSVIELLAYRTLEGESVGEDVEMGKIIGNSDVVNVNNEDVIVYAMRLKREDQGYVPFVKNRISEPCSLISIYLERINPDTYELKSTWIGEFDSPMFPQMENATAESVPYWLSHAFVWGSQKIIPGSERSDCPWQLCSQLA
jgi:hypothetical protein